MSAQATLTPVRRDTAGDAKGQSRMGAGMGLAGAPATDSIMGSLPPGTGERRLRGERTTRELGGALGVAVVGSIMSSLYASELPAGVPAGARDSLGAAVEAGDIVAAAAGDAFVHAMSSASVVVVAVVAALGAVIAWCHLPAGPPPAPTRTAREYAEGMIT